MRISDEGPDGAPAGTTRPDGCERAPLVETTPIPALQLLLRGQREVRHFSVLPLPLPPPLSFARSRECKGFPNSRFDRGVGLRGRGRYPFKTKNFREFT